MNDEPKTPLRTGQGMDYGEQADVQQVHAAVQREKREPRVGAEPLSIWLTGGERSTSRRLPPAGRCFTL